MIDFIGNKARFRIIKRNERYIPQQFHGFWKIGFYLDIAWLPEPNNYFEHVNYSDAEYVIYSKLDNRYPMKEEVFNSLISSLESSKEWTVMSEIKGFTILKRSNNNSK